MASPLELRIGSAEALADYAARQLDFFGGSEAERELLDSAIDGALQRLATIVPRVRAFPDGWFDHLHSLQYATFLYLAGHCAWKEDRSSPLVDRLFYLNKMLNCIELYPAIELPGPFLLSHALGAVLGSALYGEGLVVFQNVTVGRIGQNRPQIGRNVVLFPGASVTGKSVIGDGAVLAGGVQVHNMTVPPNSLVRRTSSAAAIEPLTRNYHALYIDE